MTAPTTDPTPAPKRKPSPLSRVLGGIGGVLLLVYGIHQMRQGASELKGQPRIDFAAAAQQSLAGSTPFTSPDGDFTLRYPTSWQVTPKPGFKFHAQTLDGIVNVSVSVEPLQPGMTVDGYVEGTFAGLKKMGIDVKPPVERANLTVSGAPAARLGVVAATPPAMNLHDDARFDMLVVVAGGKAYVMTCTTEKQAAATMKPVFDGLIDSLRLTR